MIASTAISVSYAPSDSGVNESAGDIRLPAVTHNTYDGANRLQYIWADGIPSGSLCGRTPTSNLTVMQ